jgi:hypothetical protein
MSYERINSEGWSSPDVQTCSDRTRGLFTDTLRFLSDSHCPDIGKALAVAAIITLATVIDLNHSQRLREHEHE